MYRHSVCGCFGTGYSSLAYLRRLHSVALKIDKSFLQNIADEDRDLIIVSAIIQLTHRRRLITVAIGIDTGEQLNVRSRWDFLFTSNSGNIGSGIGASVEGD